MVSDNTRILAELAHFKMLDSDMAVFICPSEFHSDMEIHEYKRAFGKGAYALKYLEVKDYCVTAKGEIFVQPPILEPQDFDLTIVKDTIKGYFGFTEDEVANMPHEKYLEYYLDKIKWKRGAFVTLAPMEITDLEDA